MLACHLNEDTDVSSRNLKFTNRSVAWIAERFGIGPDKKIADFGCGPGLYTTRLARTGAAVTGIDFSRRSIEYAREGASREGLAITYHHQDYLAFDPQGKYDLILMIMCDYCALSPNQRKRLLKRFHTCLATGGSVLLDVYSLTAFDQREESASYAANLLDGFWASDRYYGFLNIFKYMHEKLVLDKYTIVEKTRTRTIYNWLQYFSADILEKEFREAGFAIEAIYGDVAGAEYDPGSPEFALVAGKA